MTADNDNSLHEVVRQRLAGHQPPFDPKHWQAMRRKLRRRRWQVRGWWATGLLLLLGSGWLFIRTEPIVPARPNRLAPAPGTRRSQPVVVPDSRLDRTATKVVTHNITHPSVPVRPLPVLPVPVRILPLKPRGPVVPVAGRPLLPPVLIHSPAEPDIIRQMTVGGPAVDSTTYRVFSRNLQRWPNAVVICDFTSSMYSYSTQLMAWFRRNQTNQQVRGLVFFTDCDSLGRETEPGRPGQLFATRSRSVSDVLPLMLASARNTMGNTVDRENVIDPLAYAQRQFPEAEHLILVADNSSAVKDMGRLAELHTPVHIILCGPTQDTAQAFQPDYYTLARQTGGSLHTLEDDLTSVAQLPANTWIRVAGRYYRRTRRGRFVATGFRHRPHRVLGLFWR